MTRYQVAVEDEVLQQSFVHDDRSARLVGRVLKQVLEAHATEQVQASRVLGGASGLPKRPTVHGSSTS